MGAHRCFVGLSLSARFGTLSRLTHAGYPKLQCHSLAMASSEVKEPGVEEDDSLDLQEIELEQQKLELQRQELQLRERKLAVLRKRKGGGA